MPQLPNWFLIAERERLAVDSASPARPGSWGSEGGMGLRATPVRCSCQYGHLALLTGSGRVTGVAAWVLFSGRVRDAPFVPTVRGPAPYREGMDASVSS